MNFIKKLFGKKKTDSSDDDIAPVEVDRNNEGIAVYDKSGSKFAIEKDQYRKNVLPGIFKTSWDNPQELYNAIIMALNDGFSAETLEPARRLFEIDQIHERGATIFGISLLKNERYAEAQAHFESYISKNGKSGVLLTNLAKAYSFQGNETRAKEVLWEAIELFPNLSNAVEWLAAMGKEKDGEKGYLETMSRISELDGSWYADLWLARHDLESSNLKLAVQRYEKVLALGSDSEEALYMMSGDLGKHGAVNEIITLVLPVFNLSKHGIGPAMNLLQACLETKNINQGVKILSEIKALDRPDLTEHIVFYETEFSKIS